jgi:hypothetical protein
VRSVFEQMLRKNLPLKVDSRNDDDKISSPLTRKSRRGLIFENMVGESLRISFVRIDAVAGRAKTLSYKAFGPCDKNDHPSRKACGQSAYGQRTNPR